MNTFELPENCYFIYRHIRNDTGQPFYIGLGKGRNRSGWVAYYARAYSKQSRSPYWRNIVVKCGYTVEIMMDNLFLEEARAKEVELIEFYGRKDFGGILCNHNDGGDGNHNYIPTPETIQKYKDALTSSYQEQFDKYVMFEPNTGCWIWTGTYCEGNNALTISYELKGRSARRTIYSKEKNINIDKSIVINKCGCVFCVNPDHQYLTNKSGGKRNNTNSQKGSKRWNSKFTEADVTYIKEQRKNGKRNVDLAAEFNVSRQAIGLINRGINWNWLN